MSAICPTVMPLSDDAADFKSMMERLGALAPRIQVDLMDGQFAPHHNTEPSDLSWPEDKKVDVHLMYLYPSEAVLALISLRPNTIIVHAEAAGDVLEVMRQIQEAGIKAGVALLRTTPVDDARDLIRIADHVLLFGGELGSDGVAELAALDKVPEVRAIKPEVEIGWDGGANETNVAFIAGGGIDVINVGGALRRADNPAAVYRHLQELVR